MTLKDSEILDANRRSVNQINSSNSNDIPFPKKPNKRYQIFISKEKRKYDDNWENKLKDQNLTDQNFFLNYYSYENIRKPSMSPSKFSIKFGKDRNLMSNSQLIMRSPIKNVHSSQIHQYSRKINNNSPNNTNKENLLFENESTTIQKIQGNNDIKNFLSQSDNADDLLTDESDSDKIDVEFEIIHQSPDPKSLTYSTPQRKKPSQYTFSKSLRQPLPPKENLSDFDHFLNIDNTTQFAPFPKRLIKTRQEEREKLERKKDYNSRKVGASLPEIGIPTRQEVLNLKAKTSKVITSNSVQSEKFPVINKFTKLPCKILSATLTRFDRQ